MAGASHDSAGRASARAHRTLPSGATTLASLLIVVAAWVGHAVAANAPAPRLALDMEILSNTLDGSPLRVCVSQNEVESGAPHEAWLTFGSVRQQKEQGWEGIAANARCGTGAIDGASSSRARAVPFLAVGIEAVASIRGNQAELQATLRIRKFSAFDEQGRPIFVREERKRSFSLGPGEFAIVPLLVADPRERDAFDIHELYVRLGARALGRPEAAYGAVSVLTDVPGLDILVDGGVLGRSADRRPVVLTNLRAGTREVRVRDLSGRTASKQVVVEKGRTAEVSLAVLNLPSPPPGAGALVPIGRNPQGYDEFWRVRDGAIVVTVPAGAFVMGSGEREGEPSQRPQRPLHLSEFLIDKTEVTWRQFRRYAEATGAPSPPAPVWGIRDDYPVTSVLYAEAKAYCEWVGGRLPTEAEWEKAARGSDGRKYLWGNDWDPDRCNSIDGGPHQPKAVGSFPGCVSPYGVVDMAGSLWEWTADWYADGYPEVSENDPRGPDRGTHRVVRGGSWLWSKFYLYAAYRHKIEPGWRDVHNGFRCARGAPR